MPIIHQESKLKILFTSPISMKNSDIMEEEQQATQKPSLQQQQEESEQSKTAIQLCLLILSTAFSSIGGVAGPLLIRLYYLHGGKRVWLTSFLQNTGFFISFLPVSIFYFHSRFKGKPTSNLLLTPKLFLSSACIGLLFGVGSFMYSHGLSYLPLSTSTILLAPQLAFLAISARILVKQKFTPYSINSVVLMILGSVIIGLRSSGDRPANVSNAQYYLGFFLTIAAAALLGFILPLVELIYSKANQAITYRLLLQFQVGVAFVAGLFCIIGMLINKDFQAIPREAKEFGLGELKYYLILSFCAISFNLQFIGILGIILYATSLFSGIMNSLLFPITEVFAVVFLHEKFTGEKGMALVICIWGFISYFYGQYKKNKKQHIPTKEQEAGTV